MANIEMASGATKRREIGRAERARVLREESEERLEAAFAEHDEILRRRYGDPDEAHANGNAGTTNEKKRPSPMSEFNRFKHPRLKRTA